VRCMKTRHSVRSEAKSLGVKALRWRMEKWTSNWFGQLAWTGPCTGTSAGEGGLEPPDGGLTAMRGAVVHDPEDPARLAIGGLVHDLRDQAVERRDAGGRLTAPERFGAMHVERRQVRPGAARAVLMFDPYGLGGPRRRLG
jgi:hypothetical protein